MPVRGPSGPQAAAQTAQPTPAQKLIGDFSPKLVELTDEVLFGDVWMRPRLSPRDRSLVTVSALIAMNRPDQLRSHLARDNGVTQEELVETIVPQCMSWKHPRRPSRVPVTVSSATYPAPPVQ
jgi:4-carboxymuconolactone decarboxylase